MTDESPEQGHYFRAKVFFQLKYSPRGTFSNSPKGVDRIQGGISNVELGVGGTLKTEGPFEQKVSRFGYNTKSVPLLDMQRKAVAKIQIELPCG